jgi:hypothetical protein
MAMKMVRMLEQNLAFQKEKQLVRVMVPWKVEEWVLWLEKQLVRVMVPWKAEEWVLWLEKQLVRVMVPWKAEEWALRLVREWVGGWERWGEVKVKKWVLDKKWVEE